MLAEKNKRERNKREAAISSAKQQAEQELMESQRMRVRELRKDMYRHEALECYGYYPGERIFIDDWSF